MLTIIQGGQEIQARDHREANHFWADKEVVENHLPEIGAYGFAVYMLLAYHARSNTGRSWPSIAGMANRLSLSEPTIRKALEALIKAGLILVSANAKVSKNGKAIPQAYTYTLIAVDKAQKAEGVVKDVYQGGQPDLPGVVKDVYPNKNKNNKNKPTRELNTLANPPRGVSPSAPETLEPLSGSKSSPEPQAITSLIPSLKQTAEAQDSKQEEPPSVPPVSPLPDYPRLAWYTVAGDNHLVHLAKPTPSGKFIKPICGAEGHYATPAKGAPIGARQPCMECQHKASEPKPTPAPKPWSALTKAAHDAIPEAIRPPGNPHYGKADRDAQGLHNAGFTPEQITEYVTWAYVNDKWICCGGDGGAPIVITMSYINQKIKAWQTTKGVNGNEQFTASAGATTGTERSGIRQGGGGSGGAYSPAGGGGEASRAPVPSIIPAAPGIPRPASLPGVQRDRLDKS